MRPTNKSSTRNWFWLGVNGAALLPLIRLVWMVAAAPDSQGPVMFASDTQQDIILFSGQTALVLLVLSLACTPLARILGFTRAIQVRKSLGLWACGYACFHALYFMGGKQLLSERQAWANVWVMLPSILSGMTKTPYARYGAYALGLILLSAITSNRMSMRLLRHNWKRLHQLVYLAVPLAVFHYWQREESTFIPGEPPDYWKPITFAVVVAVLLLVRIPPVRKWLAVRLTLKNLRLHHRRQAPAMLSPMNQPHEPANPAATQLQGPPPAPSGSLMIVVWLIQIRYLWKTQRRKTEVDR